MVRRKGRKKSRPEPHEDPQAAPEASPEASAAEPAPESQAGKEVAAPKQAADDIPAATVPLEQHQRLLAEFDNYRKRMQREHERLRCWARADLMTAILPAVDDFERAGNAIEAKKYDFDREGMLIILNRLADLLKREGLTEVEASPGEVFDPEIHEAVLTVPSAEVREGCVAQLLERGYQVDGRLLRAAKVSVARAPESAAAPEVQ